MNILILCTGNSARSILLETLLNDLGKGRITAFSAGSNPAGTVHPESTALLDRLGYRTDYLRSKSWDEYAAATAPKMDAVIAVCGSAAGEACPIWPGTPLRAHWGIEDPAAAMPSDQQQAFQTAFDLLKAHAEAFVALPFETLDRAQLQTELTRIGR